MDKPMTRQELEEYREALRAEYQAAKQFNLPKKMEEIREAGLAVKKRLETNMCYTCKNAERLEEFGEGCYCSQVCWDTYRKPKQGSFEDTIRRANEYAKGSK